MPSERSPWSAGGRPHWGLLALAGLSVGCALVWLSLLAQRCAASLRCARVVGVGRGRKLGCGRCRQQPRRGQAWGERV